MMRLLLLCVLLLAGLPVLAQDTTGTAAACQSDRLVIGERARVMGDVILNIRPLPTVTQARVGVLQGGDMLTVLDGVTCADGFVWWRVTADDSAGAEAGALTGWVAEGSASEYWLQARGERVLIDDEYGQQRPYVRLPDGTVEREGCMLPPDDYEIEQIGYARLNKRTLFMLDNAQRIYESLGGERVNFRQLITQGSYNAGGVAASFGTHDAGGAVDISVRNPADFTVMEDDMPLMIEAMRVAGFAAWVRDWDELYDGSIIHIHAIAIGDEDASAIAQQQVGSAFGYFSGNNGLPPADYSADGVTPLPDRYGAPIVCGWMRDLGYEFVPPAAADEDEDDAS